jgi:hypothetical protein
MKGVLEEGSEVLEDTDKGIIRDAALSAASQRVEHYEMAGYGSAREFAKLLGLSDVARLLDETLAEEKNADKTLSVLSNNAEAKCTSYSTEGSAREGRVPFACEDVWPEIRKTQLPVFRRIATETKSDYFGQFAASASGWLGSKWALTGAMLVIVLWAFTGPLFHFSDTWQLVINTGTTIVTFLMLFSNSERKTACASD